MAKVTIGTASAGPGEKVFGRVPVTTTTVGGFEVYIPVWVVNGAKDGPKLVLTAGVHGNEIIGSVAVVKLVQRLDPKKLEGAVIAVPVANISAFERGDRGSLWDGRIMNRVKPRREGTVTEQLWWVFRNEIVAKGDYHVDLHSGREAYVHYTAYRLPGPEDDPEFFKKMKDMALAFGVDQVLCKTPPWGLAPDAKARQRILVEVGGGNWFKADEYVETDIKGVTNVIKYLGMLEGRIEPQAKEARIYDASYDVYSKHGGFFDRKVDFGDAVEKGQVVIEVLHPYTGELLEQVRAPVDGVVINTGTLFKAGDRASMVFGKLVETVNLNEYFKL